MKTLKTLSVILAVAILSMASVSSFAQVDDTETVTVTAILSTSLNLAVAGGGAVSFTFDEVSEYYDGIGDDLLTNHNVTITSTANWKLAVKASGDFTDGTNTIHLDQLGLHTAYAGARADQASRTDIAPSVAAPLVPTTSDQIMLTNALMTETNAGQGTDNVYTIYYEMGTKETGMNQTDMLEQDYEKSTYVTTLTYTLTEIL